MKKILPFGLLALVGMSTLYAQPFPLDPPAGEIRGGYLQQYFKTVSGNCLLPGQAVTGFYYNENNFLDPKNITKLCNFVSAATLTGNLIGEDFRIPMWTNSGRLLTGSIMHQKMEPRNDANATIFVGNTTNHNPDAQLSVGTDVVNKPGGILITSGKNENAFIDFAEKDGATTDSSRPQLNLKASIFWNGTTDKLHINDYANAKSTVLNRLAGNVGIGTTNPTSKFHVNRDNSSAVIQLTSPVNEDSTIWLYSQTGSGLPNQRNGWAVLKNRNNNFFHINYDAEAGKARNNVLAINPNGNVGLGHVTNPQEKLEVNGNIAVGKIPVKNNEIDVDGRATTPEYGSRLIFVGAKNNSDPLYMYRYNEETSRTTNDGDVSTLRMVIGDNPDTSGRQDRFAIGAHPCCDLGWNSKKFIEKFSFVSNGRLGINEVTQPKEALEVNGNISVGKMSDDIERSTSEEYGSRLFFAGAKNNSDPIYMYRYNKGPDQSELRTVIGDNPDYAQNIHDRFSIGTHSTYTHGRHVTTFQPKFSVFSNGKVVVGSGASSDTHSGSHADIKLEVEGDISVGNRKIFWDRASGEEYGNKLYFEGASHNTDPMYMYRYNKSNDESQLRMVIGDNYGEDSFRIGKVWTPQGNRPSSFDSLFTFKSNASMELNAVNTGHPYIELKTAGTYSGSRAPIGETQHAIFGPYNGPSGHQGALYIGAGRNGSDWEKNAIFLYNLKCSGSDRRDPNRNQDCLAKAIHLYGDKTYVGKDLEVWNNMKVGFGQSGNNARRRDALDVNGWIVGRNEYGQRVYMGGDAAGDDMELGVLDGNYEKIAFYHKGRSKFLSARMQNAEINGDAIVEKNFTLKGNASVKGNITSQGNIVGRSVRNSSDERLKTNISPLQNISEKIAKLRGVSFNWKDSGKKSLGFIAQEVEKIFPELVSTDENGYKSVEYANMVALLVSAFQEQNAKINDLEQKLQSQEVKIKKLEEQLQILLQTK